MPYTGRMETEPVDELQGLALARVVMREIYQREEAPPPQDEYRGPAGVLANTRQHEYCSMWAFRTLQSVAATYRAHQKRLGLPRLLDAFATRIEYEGEPLLAVRCDDEHANSDGQLRAALLVWRRVTAAQAVRLSSGKRRRTR